MAIEVPKDPKVYTTVYDNFKGVDYTNDASNVYKRRSPDGLNMLPELDGRPFKRTGWCIDVPYSEFESDAPTTTVEALINPDETPLGEDWLYVVEFDDEVRVCPVCDGTSHNCPYWYGGDSGSHMTPHQIQDFEIMEMGYTEEQVAAMTQTEKNNTVYWFTINQITPDEDTAYVLMADSGAYQTGQKIRWDGSSYYLYEEPSDSSVKSRLHHFNIDGYDYIMIFNNKGVYYMRSGIDGAVKAKLKDGSTEYDFPPAVDGRMIKADENRAFYFEGNGIAGFYVFVGQYLYRFDGTYFRTVSPYVPTILYGCSPLLGSGEEMDSINMLTPKRTVAYFGDGTSVYSIPQAPKDGAVVVEVYNDDPSVLDWETKTEGTDYSVTANTITFLNDSPPTADYDNVRITYEPADEGTTYTVETVVTDPVSLTSTRKQQRTRIKTVIRYVNIKTGEGSGTTTISDWSDPVDVQTSTPAFVPVILLTNNLGTASTYIQDDLGGSWATREPNNYITTNWSSYGDSVAVTPTKQAANEYGTTSTSDSEWIKQSSTVKVGNVYKKTTTKYKQTRTITKTNNFKVRAQYSKYEISGSSEAGADDNKNAFMSCRKALSFGNGIYNQMFLSSATMGGFRTRAWYCAKNDPSYFPDVNYIDVGADDTEVVGMIKIGSYLGFVKAGGGTESSIYLAYATTFDTIDTFAVKQGVNGIGAVSAGAFNILNSEPLFLSKEGVYGVEVSTEETDRHIRNRSWFIDGKLTKEPALENAVSFIHDGMYYLAVNNHCYVLDGSQKTSWANEKTNLQYEPYYLENIPAQCFSSMNGSLYFVDTYGNICRFKDDNDEHPYRDDYTVLDNLTLGTDYARVNSTAVKNALLANPEGATVESNTITYTILRPPTIYVEEYTSDELKRMAFVSVEFDSGEKVQYSMDTSEIDSGNVTLTKGLPIPARWSTIADDDGAVHFFKNLQKKGCVVSLLPASNSGVTVYLKADEKDPIEIGKTDSDNHTLPYEFYIKKKMKKYKRLQIICENNEMDDSFGIDQIIKSYTMGNYSKNKK